MANRRETGTGRGREVSLEAEVARSADRPPCEAGEGEAPHGLAGLWADVLHPHKTRNKSPGGLSAVPRPSCILMVVGLGLQEAKRAVARPEFLESRTPAL